MFKNRKRNFKIFKQVLKNPVFLDAIVGYLIFFFVESLVLFLVEPTITRYTDALWYSFVSCTTIGFGDLVVTTIIGKILTVLLYIYTIIILAIITAVTTHFFIEMAKARRNESVAEFQADLEHLDELPKERLKEMSETIKRLRKKQEKN